MKTKLLFLSLFVPAHAFLSLEALRHGFNPPPGGHSAICRGLSALVTAPLLLPLVMFDPDGERVPRSVQLLSLPLNSLIWGMGVLLAHGLVKRWRGNPG